MADSSFDIVSKVERQEVDNALNQAARRSRSATTSRAWAPPIEWSGERIEMRANAEERVKAILDVFQSKLVKRGISLKALEDRRAARSPARNTRSSAPCRRESPGERQEGREDHPR